MPLKRLLLLSACLNLYCCYSQGLAFYKENIVMQIRDGQFYVSGTYYLRNGGYQTLPLSFPFPEDSLYEAADSLVILNLRDGSIIHPDLFNSRGASFKLDFAEEKEAVLQISYHQALKGKQAEYIIMTTHSWGKPFEQANYELIVPVDMKLSSFSIAPDESMDAGRYKLYYWEKRNFMPDRNFIFRWE